MRRLTVRTLAFAALTLLAVPATAQPEPNSSLHKQLRRKINDFQDTWRQTWEHVQYEVHGTGGKGSSSNDTRSGQLRRSWALKCFLRTPLMVPYDWGSPMPRYPIRATPDWGAVCPSWAPPDEPVHPNEGEWIDFALPVDERKKMYAKRELLIQAIAKAHAAYPFDSWIAGQHVRFVLDQNIADRSLATAKECSGDHLWCSQLLGLVLGHNGLTGAADSVFRVADSLRAGTLPDKDGNCVALEARMLFTKFQRKDIADLDCDEQRSFVDRMWWLADPLWSTAGNERYVEHHSRIVHATLRAVTDRDERYTWAKTGGGEALREMVVRYGWPSYTYWPGSAYDAYVGRTVDQNLFLARMIFYPFTTKEYTTDRTALLPTFDAIQNPFNLTNAEWNLHQVKPKAGDDYAPDEWWPQEHMLLPTRIEPILAWQDAMWRNDSTVTYQFAADDALTQQDSTASGAALAVLMGGSSPSTMRTLANGSVVPGITLRMSSSVSSAPLVISAEVLPRTPRETALRLRYGVRPPSTFREMKANEVALSVPVFMRMPNREMPLPTERTTVLRYMAGDLSFPRIAPLALYWESYGFAPGDSLDITMTVRRNDNVNIARKLGALLGVASRLRDSITVKYSENDRRQGTIMPSVLKSSVGRAIALDVSAQPAGRYVVSVEMRTKANGVARSEQQFTIREK